MRFSSLPRSHGDLVLGLNRRNLELVLQKNPRKHYPLADDKLKTKTVLAAAGITVVPTLATFTSFFELGQLDRRLAGLSEFVIKPARGRAGRGILVISGIEQGYFKTAGGRLLGMHELKRHLADIVFGVYAFDMADTAIIEQRIHPAPFFAELYAGALCDVRLLVVEGRSVSGMIRVPTLRSGGRANLHQGAIGLGMDLETGGVSRAWHRGRPIESHPDTNVRLTGLSLPGFEEIVRLAEAAGKALPLGYLGVDMVVDREMGPVVMEVNVRPGLEIQNVTGVGLRGLLKDAGLMERVR